MEDVIRAVAQLTLSVLSFYLCDIWVETFWLSDLTNPYFLKLKRNVVYTGFCYSYNLLMSDFSFSGWCVSAPHT